jgi:Tol biopolymer transport system component
MWRCDDREMLVIGAHGSGGGLPTRVRRILIAVLLSGLSGGCGDHHCRPPELAQDGVPGWANPIEPACQPWTGGGPEGPAFTDHQTEADWSVLGFIVYRDYGIVSVDRFGNYTSDPYLRGLWVIDPRSGTRQRIRPSGSNPRWSSDGEFMVFVDVQICTMNRVGTEYRQLTSGRAPAWSHDGGMIAFESSLGVSTAIHLLDLQTMDLRRIADSPSQEPDWMPDDRHLLHLRSVGNTGQFCSMDTSGANLAVLSQFPPNAWARHGRMSPDGRRIAYSKQIAGYCRPQIWILDVETGVDYRLTWEGGDYPGWSPDGTLLVYTKHDQTQSNDRLGTLWIFNTMTGNETQLTHHWTSARQSAAQAVAPADR